MFGLLSCFYSDKVNSFWRYDSLTVVIWKNIDIHVRILSSTPGTKVCVSLSPCLGRVLDVQFLGLRALMLSMLLNLHFDSGDRKYNSVLTSPVLTNYLRRSSAHESTSAIGQPTRPTQPFILSGSINEL